MKKLAVFIAFLLILAGGAWFTLTHFVIDSEEMAERLSAALHEATGRDVQISRTAEVSLFPVPQVVFKGMRVANVDGASTPHFVDSPRFTVKLDMAALMQASAKPAEIILHEATFNLEVLPSGLKNWQFTGNKQRSEGFRAYFLDTPVRLDKGLLHYVNAATGSRSEIPGVTGVIGYEEEGRTVVFNGTAELAGEASQMMIRMRSIDLTQQNIPDAPFQLVLKHADVTFKAQGTLSSANREPEFIGEVEMEAPDLWNVMHIMDITGEGTGASQGNPVTAKGGITVSMQGVKLADIAIHAGGADAIPALKGKLDMEYRFGKAPYLRLQPVFETIDMDDLLAYFDASAFIAPKAPNLDADIPTVADAAQDARPPLERFLREASGLMEMQVGSLIYQGRSINDIQLTAELQPRRMVVREGRASMPGETQLVLAGIVSAKEEGLGFDGKFEMQGKQMEQFLALFAPKDVEVPLLELGLFGMRTNVAIDPKQIRLSEFQARVANTRMAGAVILRQGDRPKLESYLRIADINLDTVLKALAFMLPESEGVKSTSSGAGGEVFDVRYLNTRFNWLSSIGFDVDSDFLVQDFVLFDRKGGRADFHVNMGVNTLVVDKINADYNESRIAGSYGIRTEPGKNPHVQIDTTINELNMVDLFPDLARARNNEEWQAYIDEPLELMLLQTYRADVKARIGKLHIRNYTFDKVDTEISLNDNRLNIDKFNAYLWNGGVNLRAGIQAGTIPSIAFSFALENSDLVEMSQASRLLKYAAGLVGASGRVASSGVSLRSWLNNATGEMRISGTDISVQGFGISTLARAVPIARQVRDIERARELALRGGITRISQLQGLINIADGRASTPQMTYTSAESRGNVQGSVDLINETVDLLMQFALLNTEEEGQNPPMLTLRLKGPIDEVQKELETQQLENYVSRTAAERALGRDR